MKHQRLWLIGLIPIGALMGVVGYMLSIEIAADREYDQKKARYQRDLVEWQQLAAKNPDGPVPAFGSTPPTASQKVYPAVLLGVLGVATIGCVFLAFYKFPSSSPSALPPVPVADMPDLVTTSDPTMTQPSSSSDSFDSLGTGTIG